LVQRVLQALEPPVLVPLWSALRVQSALPTQGSSSVLALRPMSCHWCRRWRRAQ
jgi:hypothetical protein